MPWPPEQARAIVLDLKRRGKWPPSDKVRRELSASLEGEPAPSRSKVRRAIHGRRKRSHGR